MGHSSFARVPSHSVMFWLYATLWTVASQALLFIRFSKQEYWSGLPFTLPRYLPDPGIKHCISCIGKRILYHWATREVQHSSLPFTDSDIYPLSQGIENKRSPRLEEEPGVLLAYSLFNNLLWKLAHLQAVRKLAFYWVFTAHWVIHSHPLIKTGSPT